MSGSAGPAGPIAVVITHTPERLRRGLLALSCQTLRPAFVVVSCDGHEPVSEAVAAMTEFGLRGLVVHRDRPDGFRLGQQRNNAVRALAERGLLAGEAQRLVFLDGDCAGRADLMATHDLMLQRGGLSLGFRIDLTEAQTAAFDERALRAGRAPAEITPAQIAALDSRHRRYRRQLLWKRLGLGKPHKPKILGANFATTLGQYRAVNGQDESFVGWGQEDDDFARRVYRSGGRPAIAVRDAVVFHQWHPTRAPDAWRDGSNAGRLRGRVGARCAQGLDTPAPQARVVVEEVGGA